ncbi:MAG: hypothetical protein EHM93_18260 [Bacteroidales bacterium]|nr:MAG: hypothetical protein EHM93_18260 [Bacteroidales bacterium]
MKKILCIVLLAVVALSANAQDKKFNIGFGGGLVKGQGDLKDYVSGGIDGYLNFTYNLAPKMAAGIEFNNSVLVAVEEEGESIDATKINGVLLKGVYYFTESAVRPYAALMTGLYMSKLYSADVLGESAEYKKTKFGGGLELGLKLKWFNLGVSYHNMGKIEEAKVSYLQYNLGFNIGF